MILERYRERVDRIEDDVRRVVCRMLGVSGEGPLSQVLTLHDQADVVLCLLRINTATALRHAEDLVGRRITHCPPALTGRHYAPVQRHARIADDRRVTYVMRDPVIRGRRSWLTRYHLFKPGLSVAELLGRGVTRGDLKLVMRRGWVRLEDAA